MHNKSTYQVIRFNLSLFTSEHQENGEFSEYCVKEYQTKLISSSMKLVSQLGKEPMQQSVTYITFSLITDLHLHADKCAGQNKNNYFLWYFAWRIFNQLHASIVYSFLIAFHTKFGPDRSFGMIKKAYKETHVSSLYEFASMVETSSNLGVNRFLCRSQITGQN